MYNIVRLERELDSTKQSPTTKSVSSILPTDVKFLPDTVSKFEYFIGPVTPYVLKQLEAWLALLGYDPLVYAITATGDAPRPTWAYCKAILKRIAQDIADGKDYTRKGQRRDRSGAGDYEQREYTVSEDLPQWMIDRIAAQRAGEAPPETSGRS